jgi:hypothetical protein
MTSMMRTGDQRGFRVGALWHDYAKVVGDAGRSADLRRYLEWRTDNPTMQLPGALSDPRADGAPVRKFRVHDDIWKPYAHLFVDDERRISADLRTYIAWRLKYPALPLPGQTRVPYKLTRRKAE